MPITTFSYIKVEIYDKPAWDATATLETTLTNTESANASLSRNTSPFTASFTVKNDGTDCDYAGKGVVMKAYKREVETDGQGNIISDEETEKEFFRGFIIDRSKIIDAITQTHTDWQFNCEDVLATWEAYEYDLDLYSEAGIQLGSESTYGELPDKFEDFNAGHTSLLVRNFQFSGNAIALFNEVRKQFGSVAGGRGDLDDFDLLGNGSQVFTDVETVPESNGIDLLYKNNNNQTTETTTIKSTFLAKSQQWWVPIAWSEVNSGSYTIHLVYQTAIQHSRVQVDSTLSTPYTTLYFDDTSQSFALVQEADITVADYDWTELGDVTLVQPTDSSIFTQILIHKEYDFASEPENEEATGASLIAKFKSELPDVMTLHINATVPDSKTQLYELGDTPKNTEEVGYIVKGISQSYSWGTETITAPEYLGEYAIERLAEMQFTNEKQYRYTFGLVDSIPLPSHGNENGGDLIGQQAPDLRDVTDYIVESTNISWASGDAINIATTIRQRSDKTAAYQRISKYNMPRYFKKQIKNKRQDKINDADYAKIEGNSIIFTVDSEEIAVSLDDNILTDDGIVRWQQ